MRVSGQRFLACSETTPSITLLNSVKFLQTHYNPRGQSTPVLPVTSISVPCLMDDNVCFSE